MRGLPRLPLGGEAVRIVNIWPLLWPLLCGLFLDLDPPIGLQEVLFGLVGYFNVLYSWRCFTLGFGIRQIRNKSHLEYKKRLFFVSEKRLNI